MSIDIKFLNNDEGFLYVCHGELTGQDFIEANKSFITFEEEIKQIRYGIVDIAAAESINMSTKELIKIADQDMDIASNSQQQLVVAIVASRDVGYRIARLWQFFTEHLGWETEIFSARPEAENWIKQKVKKNFGFDLNSI